MAIDKKSVKILIIDDVESNRFKLKEIIEEMGYLPLLAENGNQAINIVGRIWPQLIVLDIAMPEMDGFEFCEIMKKDPKTREIPIIFISAYDNPEDIVKCFNLGGEDYITKPFLPEVVKARIGLHLKLYEASKELAETNRLLQTSVADQLERIEKEKRNVLYALIRVARENAAYDANHMERICYNCRVLTEAMQLSPKFSHLISDAFIDTIEMAAPLCDLGNVAIPTDILQKQTELTEEEMEIIRTHSDIGAQIIKDIQDCGEHNDFLQMSYEIAKYHHEYWNGTGYPDRIDGKNIPLSAQIVSLVSAYCALTESRVYRKAYTKEAAFELMDVQAGKKFNEDIYDILKRVSKRFH